MHPHRIWLLVGLLAAALCGCTRIMVHEGDGDVRIENGVGIVRLTTQPSQQPQVVESDGLGMILREGGMTIGYFSSDMALLPLDDCRIVVWIDETASPDMLREIAAQQDSVCPIGPGAQPQEGKQ